MCYSVSLHFLSPCTITEQNQCFVHMTSSKILNVINHNTYLVTALLLEWRTAQYSTLKSICQWSFVKPTKRQPRKSECYLVIFYQSSRNSVTQSFIIDCRESEVLFLPVTAVREKPNTYHNEISAHRGQPRRCGGRWVAKGERLRCGEEERSALHITSSSHRRHHRVFHSGQGNLSCRRYSGDE